VLEAVLGHGAVLDEAVDRSSSRPIRDALIEKEILPLTNADVEIVQAEEGKPLIFKATVPSARRSSSATTATSTSGPRSRRPTTPEGRQGRRGDARPERALAPVEDRPAQKGDYAVIKYEGTRDGVPFDGGSTERMPLIIGEDRLIPGFEDELVGLDVGGTKGLRHHVSCRLRRGVARRPDRPLRGRAAGASREGPARAGSGLRQSMGDFVDLAELRDEIRKRLERNALDKARHVFSDRIIEYAVANATIDLPDILVDRRSR
jgi:trigger factor